MVGFRLIFSSFFLNPPFTSNDTLTTSPYNSYQKGGPLRKAVTGVRTSEELKHVRYEGIMESGSIPNQSTDRRRRKGGSPMSKKESVLSGLLREMKRQILGGRTKKKKNEHVHNHYHVYPDKRYYKAK